MNDVVSTSIRIDETAKYNKIQLVEVFFYFGNKFYIRFKVGDEIRFDLLEVVYLWAKGEVLSFITR